MYQVFISSDGKSRLHARFDEKSDAIEEAEELLNLHPKSVVVEVWCQVGENQPMPVYSVRGRLATCRECGETFNLKYSKFTHFCSEDCSHWNWIKNTEEQGD